MINPRCQAAVAAPGGTGGTAGGTAGGTGGGSRGTSRWARGSCRCPQMSRAGVARKRGDPPGSSASPALSPPCPPARRQRHLPPGPRPPPPRARRVTFEDEAVTPLGDSGDRRSQGDSAVPSKLSPRPGAVPDYVARYPAIRSHRQRESYRGVFRDQRDELLDLLRHLRVTCHPRGGTDPSLLRKLRRCEYLRAKLAHLKARIRDYERGPATAATGGDKRRQAAIDRDKPRQAAIDRDKRRETATSGEKWRQTATNGEKRRQTATGGDKPRRQ